MSAGTPSQLEAALAGVRAFVLDADGVLMYRGAPIAGSVAALETLRRRSIPYRVVTNYSATHRDSLARLFSKATGLPAQPELIITAASAAAGYTGRRHRADVGLAMAKAAGRNRVVGA